MSHNHDDMNHDMDMDMDMDMRMYMVLNWENQCAFIFKEWKSTNNGEFIGGLVLTTLFAVSITSIPMIKGYAESQKSILLKIIWQLLTCTQASILMFLLMTVNGYVCLSLSLGIGIGNYIFYNLLPISQNRDNYREQTMLNQQDLSLH